VNESEALCICGCCFWY